MSGDVGTTAAHLLALYQGDFTLSRLYLAARHRRAHLPRTTLHSVTDGAMASIGSLRTRAGSSRWTRTRPEHAYTQGGDAYTPVSAEVIVEVVAGTIRHAVVTVVRLR